MPPKEEKAYVCNICLRSYRYAHSLERHRVVHRISSNASLQFFSHGLANRSPQKSPEKGGNLNESVDFSDSGSGAPSGYGAASQKQATGAKRFRCTKCQKVFKSRELCRSHLFAVHRRQEIYKQDGLILSPQKYSNLHKEESVENLDSVRSDLTPEVSAKGQLQVNDPILQVVEAVHTEKTVAQPESRADPEKIIEFEDEEDLQVETEMPKAYAMPILSEEKKRPYSIQAFKMRFAGAAENGGHNGQQRTAFFEDMIVYLPVKRRVEESVHLGEVSLIPDKSLDEIFSV